jgi:hypothetical protein
MTNHDNKKNCVWRLWSWLRGAPSHVVRSTVDWRPRPAAVPLLGARPDATPNVPPAGSWLAPQDRADDGCVVLRFPLRGEALLARLAEVLRMRVTDGGPERDPLLLTLSRFPGARLAIDRIANVEFQADRSAYCVTIEAAADTKVTLDTTDFATTVNFIAQYVAGRTSAPATPVAS